MVVFVELLRVGADYYNNNPEVAKEKNQAIVEGSKYIKDGAKQLFKQLMDGLNNAYNWTKHMRLLRWLSMKWRSISVLSVLHRNITAQHLIVIQSQLWIDQQLW